MWYTFEEITAGLQPLFRKHFADKKVLHYTIYPKLTGALIVSVSNKRLLKYDVK